MKSTVFLLCGLPGSGKTTWARALEDRGALRLSLDEEVLTRLAEARDPANDLRVSEGELQEMNLQVSKEHRARTVEALASGRTVILDNGYWFRRDRDAVKEMIEANGGQWRLLYFSVDKETQWSRLAARNAGDLTTTHFISRNEMELFATRFEPPGGEGEELVDGMTLGPGSLTVAECAHPSIA
jgi:predicted kinase